MIELSNHEEDTVMIKGCMHPITEHQIHEAKMDAKGVSNRQIHNYSQRFQYSYLDH